MSEKHSTEKEYEWLGLKVSCPAHIDIEEVERKIEDRLAEERVNISIGKTLNAGYYKGKRYTAIGRAIGRQPGGYGVSKEKRKEVYIETYKKFGCGVLDLK